MSATSSPLLGLRWAIKRSFIDYIARAPGGRGSLTDGAVATDDREIVFCPDMPCPSAPAGDSKLLTFRGAVTFRAHSGALLVPIANPWISMGKTDGEITIIDPFEQEGTARLKLASFRISEYYVADRYQHWSATDVQLAAEACVLFNNVYAEAAPLEPLMVII